jgi:TM2 domain-containing membrane protein YozV
VDDDYKEKSVAYLEERRNIFLRLMDQLNVDLKNHVNKNLDIALRNKKSKKIAILLAIPLIGLQWYYLKSPGYTVLSIVLCWTIIVPLINFTSLIKLLLMNEIKFDQEFNPEFVYYSQFNI